MALASRFSVRNRDTGAVAICVEIYPGMYEGRWEQSGREFKHTYSEVKLREDISMGALTDYKVLPWLH